MSTPPPPFVDPESLPHADPRAVALRLTPAAERTVRAGHPWVFDGSIVSSSRAAEPGDRVVVFDRKNRFLAAGLHDPEGPIRARLLVHGKPATIGPDLYRTRLETALALRSNVASAQTTGFRVLHGENDGMPGLVADLYERTLVVEIFTTAWVPHLRDLVPVFEEMLAPERILLLVSRAVAGSPHTPPSLAAGAVLAGDGFEGGIPFLEAGLHFEAHPFEGHKTGFYLDQRENRRMLGSLAEGKRVLNVFSYTGGFSLNAARGGATEVVSVDRADPVLAQARRHFDLNASDPGVAACRHQTVRGDAFEVMTEMAGRREVFDIVVVDPPSFARSASHRPQALAAYARLTTLALSLLPKNGLLVQASCSSRVAAGEFHDTVHRAARSAGRPLSEIERTGHAPDHPVGFPEGEYLKCLWARVEG